MKCLVENIIVDISFNQLGGLSTLCFLEQVSSLAHEDLLSDFFYSLHFYFLFPFLVGNGYKILNE